VVPTGVVVVTDRHQAVAPLPEQVAAAVAGGARWVWLREKDLPAPERAALAAELREVLAPVGGRLMVSGPQPPVLSGAQPSMVSGAQPPWGDALHLSAADPPVTAHRAAAEGLAVGRSCHTAADLARLGDEHYVTLSPVFPSASKPGYGPPLGLSRLAELCRHAGRPVLALGGIETPARAQACVTAGAVGVAVMGAVMRAADPAALVRTLVAGVAVGTRYAIAGAVVG